MGGNGLTWSALPVLVMGGPGGVGVGWPRAAAAARMQEATKNRVAKSRSMVGGVTGRTALCVVVVVLSFLSGSAHAFVQSPLFARSALAKNSLSCKVGVKSVRTAACAARMVYMPPRITTDIDDESDAAAALKQSLDRLLEMPSTTIDSKSTLPRSSCTSLYGNWRPSSATEPLVANPRASKQRKSFVAEDKPKSSRARGRPAMDPRPAVRDDMLPEFVSRAASVLKLNGCKMDSNLFGQQWKTVHPNSPIYVYKSIKGVTIHQMLRENGQFFTVSETDRQKVKMFELNEDAVKSYLEACQINGSLTPDQIPKATSDMMAELDSSDPSPAETSPVEANLLQSVATPIVKPTVVQSTVDSEAEVVEDEVHSEVPMQGRARVSGTFDRRKVKRNVAIRKSPESFVEENVLPPQAHEDDAVKRPVTALYNSWAADGRDIVMEVTHSSTFEEMWEFVLETKGASRKKFSVIDAGCGNGWAVRKMAEHPQCSDVQGVDGAALMIEKASSLDENNEKTSYSIQDIQYWSPGESVDVVTLVEVLYFLDNPERTVKHITESWLKKGGRFIASLDCYRENKLSHSWEDDLGIQMHCMSEKAWDRVLKAAGLTDVKVWRAKPTGPWQGTLIVTGVKR
eukprot:765852-Hanusia_phi.AAC.11